MITFDKEKVKQNKNVNLKVMELVEKLVVGPTEFDYVTKNGDVRHAKGTINIDTAITKDHPDYEYLANIFDLEKGVALYDDSLPDYFHYFDIEKDGIRQFNVNSIV
jgi:hypothetical protein